LAGHFDFDNDEILLQNLSYIFNYSNFIYKYFTMKMVFLLLFFFSTLMYSQLTKRDKINSLSESEFSDLKTFLISRGVPVKDTIVIKYDFKRERCWNNLDNQSDEYVKNVMTNFQNHIIKFNKKHTGAIAVNFREPGKGVNKLKLWDKTIILDEDLFLKNLIFSEKRMCGNSAIILNDGSYVLRSGDPHFDLLDAIGNGKN